MKKALATTLAAGAMALAIMLGGCGQQEAPATKGSAPQEQAAEAPATEQETSKEDSAAATDQGTSEQAPATKDQPAATQEQTTTNTTSTAAQISDEDAKNIALQDAGVAEADTTMLNVHLDTDDGVTKYEVEFNVGQTEYDYDIDATTGAILERSSEIDD